MFFFKVTYLGCLHGNDIGKITPKGNISELLLPNVINLFLDKEILAQGLPLISTVLAIKGPTLLPDSNSLLCAAQAMAVENVP